ncbi:ATP-dependent helicase, partial [bacterium]|nr:ATP-dependent helicase [bacterium]
MLKEGYVLEDAIMSIVAVTFTKKAANQMRTKIKENLTEFSSLAAVLSGAYISTIDAFCLRLLKENAFLVGIDPDFVIMEEIESKLLFLKEAKNIFNTRDLPAISFNVSVDFFLREVYSFIRRLKNNAINPVMFKEDIDKINDLDEKKKLGEIIFCLYAAYEERLKKENKFDFQSILLAGLSLLENKQIKEKYKDFFKYILVDEYQDTTFLQDKLLRELSSYSGNYFAVGDVNQSIYAFRDARPENMMNFDQETKKEGKSLSLTTNFRSFDEILKLSNQCFQGQMPYFQPLHSGKNKDSLCCEINLARSVEEEAEFIAQRILALLESDSAPLKCKDIVILFRGIRNISIYEEFLYKHHLPFMTVGGSGYYARPEIKDIISLLGVINNPFDDINLVRVLRGPVYRISNSTLQKLANLKPGEDIEDEEKDIGGRGNYPLYDALGKMKNLDIRDEEKASLSRLREFIDEFIYQKNKLPLGRFLYCLIQNSGYTSYVQTLSPIERKRSLANIDKFYQLVCRFEERNLIPVLEEFIAYLKEVINQETMESEENHEIEDVIQLMTIHQAKGLEFPVVFMANISPDSFPPRSRTPRYYFDEKEGFLCKESKEEEEKIKKKNKERFSCEEERLLYVAMTRAKERLILSGRIKEDLKGKSRKSRFIDYFFKMQEEKLTLKEEYGNLLIEANKVFPIKEEWRGKKYKGSSFNPEQKINKGEIERYLDFKYCSFKAKETKKSFSVTQ